MELFVKPNNYRFIYFDSISELDEHLKIGVLENRNNVTEKVSDSMRDLGALNWDRAETLRKQGDIKSYKRITNINKTLSKYTKKEKVVSKLILSPQGYSPIVPLALRGTPNNMRRRVVQKRPNKIVNILINSTFPYSASLTEREIYGATLLSLVDKLENDNIKVNLYISDSYIVNQPSTKTNYEIISKKEGSLFNRYTKTELKQKEIKLDTLDSNSKMSLWENKILQGAIIKLKNSNEKLNTFKLAYYLANPSCSLIQFARISENTKEFIDVTHDGYGAVNFSSAIKEEQAINNIFDNITIFNPIKNKYNDKNFMKYYLEHAVEQIKEDFPDIYKKY